MILTALLFGAAIIAGAGIVAVFWNDFMAVLKRRWKKSGPRWSVSSTAPKSLFGRSARHLKRSPAIVPRCH